MLYGGQFSGSLLKQKETLMNFELSRIELLMETLFWTVTLELYYHCSYISLYDIVPYENSEKVK